MYVLIIHVYKMLELQFNPVLHMHDISTLISLPHTLSHYHTRREEGKQYGVFLHLGKKHAVRLNPVVVLRSWTSDHANNHRTIRLTLIQEQ